MEMHKDIDALIQSMQQDLERRNFDSAVEKFNGVLGISLRNFHRIISRRFPVVRTPGELGSRYIVIPAEDERALDSLTAINLSIQVAASATGVIVEKLFSLEAKIQNATLLFNGTDISANPVVLSSYAVRQPVRVVAIKYAYDGLTQAQFRNLQVKYEYIGAWGKRKELEEYSLKQYERADNFKNQPMVIYRGLVLDGNTGISILNLPDAGASAGYVVDLTLYTSAAMAPGAGLGGSEPPRLPKLPKIPGIPGLHFDEE